jgi:hypothetical protein
MSDETPETYRWSITVREWNHYGDRVAKKTPAVVVAANRVDVTRQVRQMFGATYDDFRKFWSHDWTLQSVEAAS